MIFIVDNGKNYSDHSIRFCELDLPAGFDTKIAGDAVIFTELMPYFSSDSPFIVGSASSIDWWMGQHSEVTADTLRDAIREWHRDYVDEDDRISYNQQYQAALELMKALDPKFDLIDFK